ncbi:MAG: penicillin-binding protein 2 [Candidatus Saganbacteria bacterium]|nr:penicillin-binding protein 2 [Candidatus Saganbacteria bacterium]
MLGESLHQKIFRWLVWGAFLLLLLRLFWVQVIEGPKYMHLAQRNAARVIPVVAQRGIIYDRYHKVIVTNRVDFGVYLLPHLIDNNNKVQILNTVSRLTGVPVAEIENRLEIKKSRTFEPVLVKGDLSLQTVSHIEEEKEKFDAIVVRSQPVRSYPYGTAAAHVLGYVGEIDANELEQYKDEGYKLGDSIGKMGLEKLYDRYLRGEDGGQKLEIDVYGTPVRVIESNDPVPGNNLEITIDIELQREVERLLAGKNGGVVILDPISGEVLAMASSPTFDQKRLLASLKDPRHPFMNRAISAYPSGSIFKPITLISVLEEKLANPLEILFCPGFYMLGDHRANCWKLTGHGRISVFEGLVWSCDVVFYEMGRRAGPALLSNYAKIFGLGKETGIDLPQEKPGLVPDADWKQRVLKEKWYPGDSINFGIGQGYLQVSPLQMSVLYGALATGEKVRPFIVRNVKDPEGKVLLENKTKVEKLSIKAEILKTVREALYAVVVRGTGRGAQVEGMSSAGKTGTAENPGLPHAWFLCWAPCDKPEIVVAAFVEHGQHGDQVTASIARGGLEWYKTHRFKGEKPLPYTKPVI